MILPYYPRFINHIFAYLLGYFWLPCPICGRNFGGHEWSNTLLSSTGHGKGVCPKCGNRADIINYHRGFANWYKPKEENGK